MILVLLLLIIIACVVILRTPSHKFKAKPSTVVVASTSSAAAGTILVVWPPNNFGDDSEHDAARRIAKMLELADAPDRIAVGVPDSRTAEAVRDHLSGRPRGTALARRVRTVHSPPKRWPSMEHARQRIVDSTYCDEDYVLHVDPHYVHFRQHKWDSLLITQLERAYSSSPTNKIALTYVPQQAGPTTFAPTPADRLVPTPSALRIDARDQDVWPEVKWASAVLLFARADTDILRNLHDFHQGGASTDDFRVTSWMWTLRLASKRFVFVAPPAHAFMSSGLDASIVSGSDINMHRVKMDMQRLRATAGLQPCEICKKVKQEHTQAHALGHDYTVLQTADTARLPEIYNIYRLHTFTKALLYTH